MTQKMMIKKFKIGDQVSLECANSTFSGRISLFGPKDIVLKEVVRKIHGWAGPAVDQDPDCGFIISFASIRHALLEI